MVFDQPFQTASPQQLLKITCVQWRRSYQAIPTGHTSSESTASSLFRSLLLSYWKQFPNWRHIWSKRYDMGPKGPLIVFWSIWNFPSWFKCNKTKPPRPRAWHIWPWAWPWHLWGQQTKKKNNLKDMFYFQIKKSFIFLFK